MTFPADGRRAALPVVLVDDTGQVAALEAAPDGPLPVFNEGMFTIPASPNALAIHWTGGICDERVDIRATGSNQLTFTLHTQVRPGACELVGISRSVLILLTHPVDMSRTSFSIER